MKKITLISVVLASFAATAQPFHEPGDKWVPLKSVEEIPKKIRCVNKPIPSTSFFVRIDEQKVKLQVVHHLGVGKAPLHYGPITPDDLDGEFLRLKAKYLRDLGESFADEWKREECDWNAPGHLICGSPEGRQVGDLWVDASSLNIWPESLQSPYGHKKTQFATYWFRAYIGENHLHNFRIYREYYNMGSTKQLECHAVK